ncbi:hypothetical protein JTE90_024284 [Oedothorax gibbosus]|uniref:SAM domain-containing protein n=1 Tax=Oedothorax gibbosus TaxID=931172 RepID=A0AAV6VZ73_9ARAC|nr:hypothetical protein JTE90_024284 [Oedothorax gibbosus]
MADAGCANLLKAWGFADLVQKFQDEYVDEEALKSLTPDLCAELVPRIGQRAKFLSYLKLYQDSFNLNESANTSECTLDESDLEISLDCSSSASADCSSFQSIDSIPQSNTTTNLEPSLKKPKLELLDWRKTIFVSKENCNVIEVLKADPQGLVVLNSYSISQHLTSCNRRKLVDVLVKHCVKTYGRLLNRDFDILSSLIVQVFPTEDQEIYYVPPGACAKISSGKLPSKYRNLIRVLKTANVLISNSKAVQDNKSEEFCEEPSEELSEKLTFLKYCNDPWPKVESYWDDTYEVRVSQFQSDIEGKVFRILEDWPSLKQPLGFTLINADFHKSHPDCATLLFSNWPVYKQAVIKLVEGKLKEKNNQELLLLHQDSLPNDISDIIVFRLLPALFQAPLLKAKNAPNWRPSLLEVRHSFIHHVQINADFHKSHPDCATLLFSNWPVYKQAVIKLVEGKLKEKNNQELLLLHQDSLPNDISDIIVFRLLPALFQAPLLKAKNAPNWRPSLLEVRHSFIHHVQTSGEIQPFLEERKKKLLRYNLTLQPLIIVVGNLERTGLPITYVIMDNVKYKVNSVLQGVDVCFKCFHVLNAHYPKESENVWFFIQKILYSMSCKGEKKSSSVSAVITDIKHLLKHL